jgi:hypothetical protein
VLVFHHCDIIPDINNLREEEFILAHDFRGSSSLCLESMMETLTSWEPRRERTPVILGSSFFSFYPILPPAYKIVPSILLLLINPL